MPILDKTFLRIEADIKSVKIQGAESIAREAVRAFLAAENEAFKSLQSTKDYLRRLQNARDRLFATRPTEPALRNALGLLFSDVRAEKCKSMNDMHADILTRERVVQKHFDHVIVTLPQIGSSKLKNDAHIFTHCHSSAVIAIILDAVVSGKKITVHNTETRPLLQGRITAQELAKHGVKVIHYPDSAARIAIKQCDLVLLGADAIDSDLKVYNKIGSELVCVIAKEYNIPVYICTDSWKFDPRTTNIWKEEIEERSPKEIWADAPKGVTIKNYAFEKIDRKLITGIICEFGIFTLEKFVKEIHVKYKELFD